MQKKGKEIPAGLKAISVLYYVIAAGILAMGIMFFVYFGLITPRLSLYELPLVIIQLSVFIASCCGAVLYFFIARGLTKGENWTRIMTIILSIFWVFGLIGYAIFNTVFYYEIVAAYGEAPSFMILLTIIGAVGVLTFAAIAGYLLFNREIKEVFKLL